MGERLLSDAQEELKKRVLKILDLLEKEHPDARIALKFSNPLELLVATILAAQCTDERVNQVTRSLFKKYRSAEDYARADLATLEQDIKPTGFYRKKAQRLKEVCQILVEKFNSEVPRTMEDLLSLPGVARKTANIVLSNAYGVNEGIIVDTHVLRLAKRLGLTQSKTREKIERDLMEIVPREKWGRFADLLIFHGRRVCNARKPKCEICVLKDLCPSRATFST
ncbi:endonuclease III [Candidatus Bathyarchaeota archaeon]|nr:MAG: endonuclease III [Candidatus Bathyarchaeota archaeon]